MYCSNCGKKLKENIYTCSKCGFENISPKKYSNQITISRYIFYTLASFGLYELVWIYRTWNYIKEKENLDISPFWRTFFIIFYIRKLLRKIKEYAESKEIEANFSPTTRAVFWIIGSILENRYNKYSPDSAFPIVVTFLILLKPISIMNTYYNKTEINTTERPTEWWHTVLLVLGILLWVSLIINPYIN